MATKFLKKSKSVRTARNLNSGKSTKLPAEKPKSRKKKPDSSFFHVRTRVVGRYLIFDVPGFSEITPDHLHIDDVKNSASVGSRVTKKVNELLKAIEERKSKQEPLPSVLEGLRAGLKSSVKRDKVFDLSIGEFANLRSAPVHEIRRAADRGQIPFRKTSGGHRKFSSQDL